MDPSTTPDLRTSLLGVSFNQKWDLLKPVIERQYVHEQLKLSDIVENMRDHYSFDASEPQYKYKFKKWGFKKSTATSKKAALSSAVQKRAKKGKSTAITRAGKPVDTKNLERYWKTEARRAIVLCPEESGGVEDGSLIAGRIAQFGNKIFMNWNMPYGTTSNSNSLASDHVSPMSDYTVATPPYPHQPSSPMNTAVQAMTAAESTRLFARGRHNDLLKSMDMQQRITMSTWMYQFWFYSFKTAKYWGRGPRDWTASMLGFNNDRQRVIVSFSSPNTPSMFISTPTSQLSPSAPEASPFGVTVDRHAKEPSPLCHWSIHCDFPDYDAIPSPPWSPPRNLDLDNEQTSNDFSDLAPSSVPINLGQVSKAAQHSTRELLEEALGFSIMSGNSELTGELLENYRKQFVDSKLYPFHLAVSYLKGSKDCCLVLNEILRGYPISIHKLYVNDLGHTVLDQIMINILKSHTSCLPEVVDSNLKNEKWFEGQDIDICGRWDADSDCVRSLVTRGDARVPFRWKHVFCHTSAQAICHCIQLIDADVSSITINQPSGLFVRRCLCCGLKMELLPLHTLVLIGLHLCRSGCDGETLFGVVAALLCLLWTGANPLLKAQLSLRALLGQENPDTCEHEELSPIQLAEKLAAMLSLQMSAELRTGWLLFCNVLWHADQNRRDWYRSGKNKMSGGESQSDDLDIECEECGRLDRFGGNKLLAALWAAVQTEMLTYRRVREGDGWVSGHFDMHALNDSLTNGIQPRIPFLKDGLMKPLCSCGAFLGGEFLGGEFLGGDPLCTTADKITTHDFSNLEDWNRSNFIICPEYY